MVIRIRWRATEADTWNRMALALGSLFAPLALLAFTIAFWAFAAEAQWTGAFLFQRSFFSHWEIWLAIAALLMACGRLLGKFGMAGATLGANKNPA